MTQQQRRRRARKRRGRAQAHVGVRFGTAVLSLNSVMVGVAQPTAITTAAIGCFAFDDRVAVVPENFKQVTQHFAVVSDSVPWNSSGRMKFPIALRTDSRIEITVQGTHNSPVLLYGSPQDPPVNKLTFGPCNVIDPKQPWGINVGAIQVQRRGCVELSVRSVAGVKSYEKGAITISVGAKCPAKAPKPNAHGGEVEQHCSRPTSLFGATAQLAHAARCTRSGGPVAGDDHPQE